MDPSGHYVETIYDAYSFGSSVYELAKNPNLENAGLALYDGASIFLPVPAAGGAAKVIDSVGGTVKKYGSKAVKGVKKAGKAVKKVAGKAKSKVKKAVSSAKSKVKKLFGGKKSPKKKVKNKTGPKPKGTGTHNLKIEEVASQVTDGEVIAGGGRYKEKVIPTPNGKKSSRRPDILVQKPDGSLYGINVGKTTANGAPIKREVEALYDLEDAGIPMYFVGYDK